MAKDNNQSGSQGGGQGSTNQGQSGQSGTNQGSQSGGQSGSGEDFNSNDANVEGWKPGQVGEVQDESHDGRLKENRMEGKTLGTTEHSADAPHAIDKDRGQGESGGSYGSGGNNSDQGNQGGSSSGSGNQGSGSQNQGGNNR